ncbi:CAP domain-containing protein [Streptomyces sp. NPDC054787]
MRGENAGYCANGTSWEGHEIASNGWGGNGTPRAAVTWWLQSPTHAEIIRNPALTEFGIAPRGGAADPAEAGVFDAGTYVVTLGRCEKERARAAGSPSSARTPAPLSPCRGW